jgi:hypothetical protein
VQFRRSRHRSAICSGNSDGSTGNTGEDGPLARRSGHQLCPESFQYV